MHVLRQHRHVQPLLRKRQHAVDVAEAHRGQQLHRPAAGQQLALDHLVCLLELAELLLLGAGHDVAEDLAKDLHSVLDQARRHDPCEQE